MFDVPVMTLEEFNQQELWRWILPSEFSFEASGRGDSIQPVPTRFRASTDVSVDSHRLRVELAVLRKRLGCPPIYWMQGAPKP